MVYVALIVAIQLFIIAYTLYFGLLKHLHFYKLALKIPGPKTWKVFGYVLTAPIDDFSKAANELTKQYPSPIGILTGPIFSALIHKREDFETILKHPSVFDKTPLYGGLGAIANEGLLTTNKEPLYKQNKRILMKNLNSLNIYYFTKIFEENASIFCNNIKGQLGNKIEVTKKITLAIASGNMELVFGTKIPEEKIEILYDCAEEAIQIIYSKISLLIHLSPKLFYMTSKGKKFKSIAHNTHALTKKILLDISNGNGSGNVFFKPLYESWLNYAKDDGFSLDDILDEIKTFSFAATDTSSAAICLTLMTLGAHKDIQDKVVQELHDIFPEEQLPILPDDLKNMTYLECVIKETLRILPIIGFMGRTNGEDIKLGKITIPKGTNILFNIYQLHRDATIWEDPLKFDPDRFLPDEFSKIPPYSYIPWSIGPRICPGMQFSIIVIKIFLATILRRYVVTSEYASACEIDLDGRFIAKAKNGNYVTFKSRM